MKPIFRPALGAVVGLMLLSPAAFAAHKGGLEACLSAAKEVKAGDFVKVEYLIMTSGGRPTYEIEVRDADGVEWELMCDARGAYIYEIEREVDSPDDPLFKARAKVSEADAKATALALYPGEVKEVEYEIEMDGSPTYEFDIVDKHGVEWKVEVSAETGEIIEVAVEKWEIGMESGERR